MLFKTDAEDYANRFCRQTIPHFAELTIQREDFCLITMAPTDRAVARCDYGIIADVCDAERASRGLSFGFEACLAP